MIVSLGLFRDERGERHAKDRDSKAMAAFENKSVVLNSGYTAITRHIHSHAYMQLKTDKKALFHVACCFWGITAVPKNKIKIL